MIAADLRPSDPVRWYFAYAVERAEVEREHRQDSDTVGSDVEVLDT
jgi:hypothetical protein